MSFMENSSYNGLIATNFKLILHCFIQNSNTTFHRNAFKFLGKSSVRNRQKRPAPYAVIFVPLIKQRIRRINKHLVTETRKPPFYSASAYRRNRTTSFSQVFANWKSFYRSGELVYFIFRTSSLAV